MKWIMPLVLLLCHQAVAQHMVLKAVAPATKASFRGLSVVNDKVVWVSGSNGTVGRSTNGGHTWHYTQVANYGKADFRSLYAFDSLHAVIASTDAPAVILRTDDGGKHWNTEYRSDDTAMFFDGMDFWNSKEGMIYGDPVKHHLLLMTTHDGGRSWKKLPNKNRPKLEKGEASFASSNTGIRCIDNKKVVISTGGMRSRVFTSEDKGLTWKFLYVPIATGKSSTGIYSIACRDDTTVVVGGDYTREKWNGRAGNVYFLYENDHDISTWHVAATPTRGYRECVEFMNPHTLIAVGPTGFDITKDAGVHWHPLNNETGYHVVRKSRKGKLIVAAGAMGKIGILSHAK